MPGIASTNNNPKNLPPSCKLRFNGVDITREIGGDLMSLTVNEDVDAPGMFALQFVNGDIAQTQRVWADDKRFAPGTDVEVQLGYVDHYQRLILGEITGLEPEYIAGEVPTLTVRGHDIRHRLLRGRHNRAFSQLTDSEIATQVFRDCGLSSAVTATEAKLEMVYQHNQTDMEFLRSRARRIGYEIAVDGKTVLVRPRPLDKKSSLRLSPVHDLLEFTPRLTTLSQVGQVTVASWNPDSQSMIHTTVADVNVASKMGGSMAGPAAATQAFGSSEAMILARPTLDQKDAQAFAKGQINEMALAYITGEGTCVGRTDLRAGMTIEIVGIGRRFSGLYYVTSTTHSLHPDKGYRTSFSVRRNAT